MAALPYIQFYPADYLADTVHLTLEEQGAYLLLILNYWQRGSPIPVNRLASTIHVTPEKWDSIKDVLLDFFVEEDGYWMHDRIDLELKKVLGKSIKATRAGKASAKKRAENKALQAAESKEDSNERSTPNLFPLNHTDTDTDTEAEKKESKKKKNGASARFTPPSKSQVSSYITEKGFRFTADAFIDYYEANGWMRGKTKIKCWKACARTWASNEYQSSGATEQGVGFS